MLRAQYEQRGPAPQDLIEAVEFEAPELQPGQVLLEVLAAPINPSDLGLLFGPADMSTAKASGSADEPVVTADVPANLLRGVSARLDQSLDRVLTKGLEEPIARRVTRGVGLHHGLEDERVDLVDHVDLVDLGGERLGLGEREVAGEDPETIEQRLFVDVEQLV